MKSDTTNDKKKEIIEQSTRDFQNLNEDTATMRFWLRERRLIRYSTVLPQQISSKDSWMEKI